jgi:hypothetical protein
MSKRHIITTLITFIIALGGVWYIQFNQSISLPEENNKSNPLVLPVSELDTDVMNDESQENQEHKLMELVVYTTSPDGSVEPVTIQTPQTVAIADASLNYLFNNNLSVYGDYRGVTINNEIAYVSLEGNIPGGRTFSSLSSTEIFDLTQSIEMTLLQYPGISEVVLVDKNENFIEF